MPFELDYDRLIHFDADTRPPTPHGSPPSETEPMRSRLWLLAPAAWLFVADAGLTLAGQSEPYWAGEYGAAVEGNPIAHPLLVRSPWLFASLAVAWLAIFSAVIVYWRHPAAKWMAVLIAMAHAIGGASWITRVGPWGLLAAGAYIAAAAQATGWCWRRAGKPSERTAS